MGLSEDFLGVVAFHSPLCVLWNLGIGSKGLVAFWFHMLGKNILGCCWCFVLRPNAEERDGLGAHLVGTDEVPG